MKPALLLFLAGVSAKSSVKASQNLVDLGSKVQAIDLEATLAAADKKREKDLKAEYDDVLVSSSSAIEAPAEPTVIMPAAPKPEAPKKVVKKE